jgi:hypothetical protein
MWLFCEKGFVSIVVDRDDPDRLLVRARVKGDIERLWPMARVVKGKGTDYAYRASLPRRLVGHRLAEEAKEIGYDNFKAAAAVQDHRRSKAYFLVWDIMADLQDQNLKHQSRAAFAPPILLPPTVRKMCEKRTVRSPPALLRRTNLPPGKGSPTNEKRTVANRPSRAHTHPQGTYRGARATSGGQGHNPQVGLKLKIGGRNRSKPRPSRP